MVVLLCLRVWLRVFLFVRGLLYVILVTWSVGFLFVFGQWGVLCCFVFFGLIVLLFVGYGVRDGLWLGGWLVLLVLRFSVLRCYIYLRGCLWCGFVFWLLVCSYCVLVFALFCFVFVCWRALVFCFVLLLVCAFAGFVVIAGAVAGVCWVGLFCCATFCVVCVVVGFSVVCVVDALLLLIGWEGLCSCLLCCFVCFMFWVGFFFVLGVFLFCLFGVVWVVLAFGAFFDSSCLGLDLRSFLWVFRLCLSSRCMSYVVVSLLRVFMSVCCLLSSVAFCLFDSGVCWGV